MAYISFVSDKPVIADSGGTVITNTRTNLMAVRDAVVAGAMEDWNYSQSGGTAEYPGIALYSKSAERVRLTITWGSSGGSDGNPTTILYEYSANSGGLYEPIGTQTFTWDSSGNLTATTWS